MKSKKVFFGYIPVISKGMLEMLQYYGSQVDACLVWGESFIKNYRPLQKDIRALSAHDIQIEIVAHRIFKKVQVVETDDIAAYQERGYSFVMPDETETRDYANQHLIGSNVAFDDRWRLRWDKTRTLQMDEVIPNLKVSYAEFVRRTMGDMRAYSRNSADWWRQIGACIMLGGKVVLWAYNKHVPSDHSSYIDGDPRINFKAGLNIDSTTVIHAETSLIAQAAKKGISLNGAELYTTTFPCAWCARAIAESGIATCYFAEGYSNLDAQNILQDKGVEIILVQ